MPKLYEVIKVTDELGFGSGSIGVKARIENPADELNESIRQVAENTIMHSDILVPVDKDKDGEPLDDDGCGDGREVEAVFMGHAAKEKSLNRSKVFGAGIVMESAALIGLGLAAQTPVQEIPIQAASRLNTRKINYGGHTGPKFAPETKRSGCGAIDELPATVRSVVTHEKEFRGVLPVLGIGQEPGDDDLVTAAFVHFGDYHRNHLADKVVDYDGAQVVQETLIQNGKVVKALAKLHKEVGVLFNDVEDMTVSQEVIRQATDGAAQVFAVDLWRLRSIAQRSFDNPRDQRQAFISMVIHTLGVAEVLTAGDLPIWAVKPVPVAA